MQEEKQVNSWRARRLLLRGMTVTDSRAIRRLASIQIEDSRQAVEDAKKNLQQCIQTLAQAERLHAAWQRMMMGGYPSEVQLGADGTGGP